MVVIQKLISVRALLGIITERLLCDTFSEMHAAAEHIIGHPIWTHEFADKLLVAHLKDTIVEQHADLDYSEDEVTDENWRDWIADKEATLGTSRMIQQGSEVRHRSPMETLQEVAPHARVIQVALPPSDEGRMKDA